MRSFVLTLAPLSLEIVDSLPRWEAQPKAGNSTIVDTLFFLSTLKTFFLPNHQNAFPAIAPFRVSRRNNFGTAAHTFAGSAANHLTQANQQAGKVASLLGEAAFFPVLQAAHPYARYIALLYFPASYRDVLA